MQILLTNDDGIHSEGLALLRECLLKQHDVYVMAPEKERTCVGHAITLHKPLRVKDLGDRVFASNGTPVDCVLLGLKTLFSQPPDFIISGINKGPNMGQDINYSGTVAAAREGAFLGIPSMAVSINARKDYRFADAAKITEDIIGMMKGSTCLARTFLNINIPNISYENIKDFMVTRLGKRVYNDAIVERIDPRGGRYYWIGGNSHSFDLIEGTDFYAVENGYASITPIDVDTISDGSINILKQYLDSKSLERCSK
ncbi:MAG: 5'/3'-nucleotidase SurE [Proteobacteria bacterium]|nr:5'/3'-nucleotidase SurE [Pseudomonadota bacterium]